MSIAKSVRDAIPPVHPAGYPFIGATLLAAVVAGFFFSPGFWLLLGLAIWMTIFFRDPRRTTPMAPRLVVSPADGRVEPAVTVTPPPELGLGPMPRRRVSIFMNVFDCHINRTPVEGVVRKIVYRPGKFVSADLDKASEDNERNAFLIETREGDRIGVVQIAGLVARRILCWTGEGAGLMRGERIGMIRFGSRLDVFLPDDATIEVLPGQRAVAGETVIARLAGGAPASVGAHGGRTD